MSDAGGDAAPGVDAAGASATRIDLEPGHLAAAHGTLATTAGSARLSSGQEARVVPLDDGWALEVDGLRQSHVGRDDLPSPHATVRWMLAGLSAPLAADAAPRVAHLGGAAMSLPRQVAYARPDARQVVVELERAIAELVVEHAPPPAGIDVVVDDGRAWLEAATPASLDAIAIDVYAGGRIPPAFTTIECAHAARRALGEHGVLVVNGVAGPELAFTAAHLAGLEAAFEHVALIVQGSVLAGARFGNAVLLASPRPLAVDPIRAALSGDASRGALVADVSTIVAGAAGLRDADERWSPEPIRSAFIPPRP